MKIIEVRINGVSPLLQHRFPEEDQGTKTRKKSASSDDSMVEASLYRLPDGTIYQPSTHILGCLKAAGARFQIVGRRKSTFKNVIGGGAVIIEPDAIPHIFQRWQVDVRAVVNPSTKGRVLRKRPVFKEWGLSFRMLVDEEEMPVETLKEIFDLAGRSIGIGDYRPQRGGPFGRFMIIRFEVQ